VNGSVGCEYLVTTAFSYTSGTELFSVNTTGAYAITLLGFIQ
jgi:hypothetical protein